MSALGHIDSYYAATCNQQLDFAMLQGDHNVDVCIVGGGYTGLSCALHLREKGFSVKLLEAERVGWGASGRNGGHVGVGQREDQQKLESMVGPEHAARLWDLGLESVSTVTDLIQRFNINCDLKQGNLHVAAKHSHVSEIREDCEHLQQHYDYDKVRMIERDELEAMTSSRRYHGGVLDQGAYHLHPLNYALGLASAAAQLGAELHEHSRVCSYEQSATGVTVKTEQGTVRAKHMVLACNGYLGKLCPAAARTIIPINNFVIATETLSEDQARSLIRDDTSVSDSLFVINYWKLSGDNRLLFGGGETYTSRFPNDIPGFVRKYMLEVYPELEQTRIDYGWGGTLGITMNRMPSFGRINGNILYAQGYSGHGVPIATLAGKLIAEATAGSAERFDVMANVPSPSFPGGTLLRWPALVVGMAWYALLDRL